MAAPSPGLTDLTKEDLKNLRKQQEKAKRDENAKQKISPTYETPALSANVRFDPPVKIEESEDSIKVKEVLGEYDYTASRLVRNGKYYEMVGVERQPSTPLPSKQQNNKQFFSSSSSSRSNLNHRIETSHVHSSSNEQRGKPNSTQNKHSAMESHNANKSQVRNKVNNSLSAETKNTSGSHGAQTFRSSGGELHSGRSGLVSSNDSRKSDQKHENENISGSDHKSANQNTRKLPESSHVIREPAVQPSKKQQPVREPVLQAIKQELTVLPKTNQQRQSQSEHPAASTDSERKNKVMDNNLKQSSESRTVLKVKEENRNGAVVNGAKMKNRPTLNINVEEILKEFQVPKPLTGIQTPFKESKFPFQENKDLKAPSKDILSGLDPLPVSAPVVAEPTVKVVEDIDDKDPSSSSSSSSSDSDDDEEDNDDDEDNDNDGEEGEDNANEGFDLTEIMQGDDGVKSSVDCPVKPDVCKPSIETKESKTRSLVAVKVPPMGMDTSSSRAPHGTSDRTRSMCSGSESSSSSSESGSEVGSDSESDKELSDDEPQSPHQTTPEKLKTASPSFMETTPPASRKWGLREFLPTPTPTPASSSSKQQSIQMLNEAPASDKSDPDHFDEVTDMKRGADHISDDNPPSNDQDALSKPMSADEFSPPAPLEHKLSVLSPVKSLPPSTKKSPTPAVKSPMKNSFHRNKAAEKFYKSPKSSDRSVVLEKKKEDTSVPDKGVTEVTKSRRSRKKSKMSKCISQMYVDDSDSESEIEIPDLGFSPNNVLNSPQSSLPVISQKSPAFSSTESTVCSTKPSTSSAKRKESKREKLHKDNVYVKLKPTGVPNTFDCDSRKAEQKLSSRSFTDPIEHMLIPLVEEKPVSPIRNGPYLDYNDQLRKAGIAVSLVKPVNGNIPCTKVKPVIVRLDLNLLSEVLNIDKHSHDFLKPKSLKDHSSLKHQKLTSSAKQSLPSVIKSKKVLEEPRKDKNFKSTASKLSANSVSCSDSNDRKLYVPEKESNSNSSLTRKDVATKNDAPILSDNSSSSSSDSDSEIEVSKPAVSIESLSSSNHSSFSQSPDKKKRKLENSRGDDSKRRKTSSFTRSPARQSTPINGKERSHGDMDDGSLPHKSHKEPVQDTISSTLSVTRERHNSASSQHSTHSNISQRSSHSQQSTHSQHSTQSHKHKRARTQEESASLKTLSSSSIQSLDRSKSTSVVTSVVKSEPVDTSKQNGFTTDAMYHSAYTSIHRCHLADKEDLEKLLTAESYSKQAKRFKHQADEMKMVLTKFVFYWESSLCFILCGCTYEKDNKILRASNMYQDILKFIGHQYQQFQMFDESEHLDSVYKLKILCLRIQALVSLKLYYLKRNETVKMKRIIEDNYNKSSKSSSQPKPPSAPSPHQPSWNRSTGTPSPMSPTPSPANSVCSVGSVGSSDQAPSKLCNGTSSQSQIVPPGSVIVPQRISSITQQYFTNSSHLVQGHELWTQADSYISNAEIRDFFAQLDVEHGQLTLSSSLLHLVRYVRKALSKLQL